MYDDTVKQMTFESTGTLINFAENNANKAGINIVTLSECWTSKQCYGKDLNAPNHELTRDDKLAAFVVSGEPMVNVVSGLFGTHSSPILIQSCVL